LGRRAIYELHIWVEVDECDRLGDLMGQDAEIEGQT
jgi:hypothetical protein